MAKNKHMVNASEHYTVVIALMISLVTTFLLGFLMTETLWGGGLRYFSNIASEGKAKKSYNDYLKSLQVQGANAAVLSIPKKYYRVDFDGVVSDLGPGVLLFNAMNRGASVTGTYYFGIPANDLLPENFTVGHYVSNLPYVVNVADYVFRNTGQYDTWVWNATPGEGVTIPDSYKTIETSVSGIDNTPGTAGTPSTPISSIEFNLNFTSQSALTTDGLPTSYSPNPYNEMKVHVVPAMGADITATINRITITPAPQPAVITRTAE